MRRLAARLSWPTALATTFWALWGLLRPWQPGLCDRLAEASPFLPLLGFWCLWIVCAAIGAWLADHLGLEETNPGEWLLYCSLLGFAALSLLVFSLAALGWLYGRVVCWCVVTAGAALALRSLCSPRRGWI